MELDDIPNTLHFAEQTGHVITTEKTITLYNSLLLLQNKNQFRRVFFWGCIYGEHDHYFIAFGYKTDALQDRTFYYSKNGLDWKLLPQPSDSAKKIIPLTHPFNAPLKALSEIPDPQVNALSLEDRLAVIIYFINQEAAVVPRGALYKRKNGVIVHNLAFKGLTSVEARELKSFLHYRVPERKWNVNLSTRDDYNYAMDFLDPLDVDFPEGCWMVNLTAGEEMVGIKSLYWPGMFFYHYLKTPKHGFVYFGTGFKCLDVPFFLNEIYPDVEDFYQEK